MRELHLRPYHEVSGAMFRPEAGWAVPETYRSVDAEVLAVRHGAGMIDLSDREKVRVTGADRTSFLDGLVTIDVKTLAPGASAYGLVLTDKSRVVGDLRIYAFEDRYVLDIDAAQRSPLLAYIQKFLVSDDVLLEEMGPSTHLEVHGPSSAALVSKALGEDVRGTLPGTFATFLAAKKRIGHVARVAGTGEVGFAIWAIDAGLEDVWSRLERMGVSPVGRDAYEVLRIEAGIPRVGADMGEDTLALEVAPEGAIDFRKGCYVGQEVVARATYQGHMNRRLMGLRVDGDVVPSRGDLVRASTKEVGVVTSGAWSPTQGWVVALGLVRAAKVTPESDLFVDHRGWDLRASLHPLPFVRARG
jgi:folate-binding protein YgfZ